MASAPPKNESTVRPLQYRDWDAVSDLLDRSSGSRAERVWLLEPLQKNPQDLPTTPLRRLLDAVPGQWHSSVRTFVLEQADRLVGFIQVAPFNQARSTWRVERICLDGDVSGFDSGTQLLRYCMESIWEARTWLVEVEVNHVDALGLYRQNGFQPLSQMTRWQLSPATLEPLALRSPSLPNLLPVNNADSALLYQLDTAAMPPFVRQVFDRHVQDFQRGLIQSLISNVQIQLQRQAWANGYVFEPQRKAAIGYFSICLNRVGTETHGAQMTVHPAYTWLYQELLAHMAHLSQQACPSASLSVLSADYQPEREDYLQQVGAERMEHALMLSRSVWHKVRESKTLSLEALQLTEMLQGLQPNTPAPGRMSFLKTGTASLQPQSSEAAIAKDTPTKAEGRFPQRSTSDILDSHGSCG
ncbi:GNAT family N-acetyltransferase [Altericista sp. CCNU0014]|uniref:GNAT family N-acetyltransferase n=1 Tax=Altericista sp. CCNU0014 TaxID=3082949 RepID=UPI00384E9C81